MNYFTADRIPDYWDKKLHCCTIPDKLDWLELEQPFPCGDGFIEPGFKWNGASVGLLRKIPFLGFPKWKHPMATLRHDYRCGFCNKIKKSDPALYKKLRKIADEMFYADVGIGGTWWEQRKGYIGVRIGSWF